MCSSLQLAEELDSLDSLRKSRFGPSDVASLFCGFIDPSESLRSQISSIRNSKKLMKFADVSVVLVSGTGHPKSKTSSGRLPEIRAHSAVLFSRSSFFRSLLQGSFRTDDQLTLELGPLAENVPKLDGESFLRSFVAIMYGDSTYTPSLIEEAFLLIDRLNFYGVDDELAIQRAQQCILSKINIGNCISLFKSVLDSTDFGIVKTAALQLICRNLRLLYLELEKDPNPQMLLQILLYKATFE